MKSMFFSSMQTKRIHMALAILMAMIFSAPLSAGTLEKIGLPPETRALVIHADDVGMCWSANQASIEAMEKGSVTCGSAMFPCPWIYSTAADFKRNPKLDIGVHLTLTNEWKLYKWGTVLDKSLAPNLLDENGFMWGGVMEVYKSVGANLDQVEKELQAQIDFARKLGIQPTHIDSHMGTLYYNENYFKIACNLALKNDLPFMAFQMNPANEPEEAAALKYYNQALADKLENAGFPLVDTLIMDSKTGDTYEAGFENYCKTISEIKPGLTLLIVHLGKEGEELKNITGSHASRDQQYRIFTDTRMADHLRKENITLLGWRELQEQVWNKRDKSIKSLF